MAYAANDWKDGITWTGAANSQVIGPFTLNGGKYFLSSSSSGTNSLTIELLGPDGTTYIPCGAAQTNSYGMYDLPPGTYEIIGGSSYGTGIGSLIKVPYNPAY